MSLLNLSHISAFYGQSQALFDVNLDIDQGDVVALMGRNGMGKSTTIKDISKVPMHKVARLGLGLVPEGRRCFSNLTVYENLIAAARRGDWDFLSISRLFPRLHERKDQAAGTLSGGEQQMLAIGRALMTNPRLLILDEATEGLAPVVRQEIWSAIALLKEQTGMAILVVDKSLKELATVADKAVILEKGKSVWSGAFDALDEELTDQYLGV
jgi:branched-chain amino acid transport system ATP-binding protein